MTNGFHQWVSLVAAMPLADSRQEALRLVASLGDKEKQILIGLVQGLPITSIAASLFISAQQAEQATQALMEKLSARSTADLVRIGIYARLPTPH
jgi:FixJ family two-component response regulator